MTTMDDGEMVDGEHMTREQERALTLAEAARARVAAEQAEARVRAALRAMLAVDARVTAATLRWELWEDDDRGARVKAHVSARVGDEAWPPADEAAAEVLGAAAPGLDWREIIEAADVVTRASLGAAGHDGEEWTEVRE